jgi:phosphate-selective porin OprO/OprP
MRSTERVFGCVVPILLCTATASAQTAAEPQTTPASTQAPATSGQPENAERPRGAFRWRNRPSIQIGDVRLDIRFKTQLDWRTYDPEIGEEQFDRRSLRGGINGEIGDHFEFQLEHDLYGRFDELSLGERAFGGEWKDVFFRWRTFRQAEVTVGRFKVPFGREELVSFSDIDFAYRALVSTTIPPARDKGVMVNGRFLRRALTYEVGVFDDDGDNGRLTEPQFSVTGNPADIGPSFAARLTGLPMRHLSPMFDTFRLGFAFGAAQVPEGLNSLRGQAVWGHDFFEPVYVKGRRTRLGAELTYTPGPVGVQVEWMQAREERNQQGLGDVDLSDIITSGWYVSGTWLITGEDKEDFNNPRTPLFRGGIGAVEVAARVEKLQFESEDKTGPAFRNPRAAHILPNSDTAYTVGVNWFLDRWVRITINGIREEFDDLRRTPLANTLVFWSGVGRLQLTF